jgi:hypothetical protein
MMRLGERITMMMMEMLLGWRVLHATGRERRVQGAQR